VSGRDVVCVNLFDAAQVEQVLHVEGILSCLSPGTILVLHTTSAPQVAIGLAKAAGPQVQIVDAAFSGSPQQAAEGALTIMAGGDGAVFAKVAPVLGSYASYLRHVGPLGSGMRLKLLNNLLFGAHCGLAREVFRLAKETGISVEALADVIARSSGASAALGMLSRHPRSSELSDGMKRYLGKDVASALAAAASEGLDLGLLSQVASAAIADRDGTEG